MLYGMPVYHKTFIIYHQDHIKWVQVARHFMNKFYLHHVYFLRIRCNASGIPKHQAKALSDRVYYDRFRERLTSGDKAAEFITAHSTYGSNR